MDCWKKAVSGFFAGMMLFAVGCSTNSKVSEESSTDAVSNSGNSLPNANVYSPLGTNVTPGAVTVNRWLCIATRPDKKHEGKTFIEFGKGPTEACQKAIALCSRLTGGSVGPVIGSGGAGTCVAKQPYDAKFRAAGAILGAGSRGWACTASERTNTGRGRTFPGVGETRMQAYDAAKKLCELRGGVRCSIDALCTDQSNGRITKN